MNPAIPGTVAVLVYLAAAAVQFAGMSRGTEGSKTWIPVMATIAVTCHALTLYMDLFGPQGVNLGLFPMLSLMAVSIVGLIVLNSFRQPVDNLFIIVFPIAAVTVVLELLAPANLQPRSDLSGGIIGHIILSVMAYSLLTIAALQAAMLSFGDYELRQRNLSVLKRLPPLQTMESLLFETLWVGLVFLTLSIATGFVFITDFAGPGIVHHTVITMAAWVVFAVLIWGRYQLGWRGAVASRWALSGFVILVIGYFGSKLVLEVILGRV